MKLKFAVAVFAAFQILSSSAHAVAVIAPISLSLGETISSIPNGPSSSDDVPHTKPFDSTQAFSFAGTTGTLRERVLDYSDRPSTNHPGLYFDFEITLLTGSISSLAISGYNSFTTSVKECGISVCGGSGANGVVATSVSRSADGDLISWVFGNLLTGGHHSANLQIFSNAPFYIDPPAFLIDGSGNSLTVEVASPASAVPEPSTWAMLILGFGGVGFMSYRRRNQGNALTAA